MASAAKPTAITIGSVVAVSARSWNTALPPLTAAAYGAAASRNQMLPSSGVVPSGGAIVVHAIPAALSELSHAALPRNSSTDVAPVAPTSTSIATPRSEKQPPSAPSAPSAASARPAPSTGDARRAGDAIAIAPRIAPPGAAF